MARKALIETATGKVVNVIVADDNWKPPQGHFIKDAEGVAVGPGDTWDGAKFVPRPPSAEGLAATKREEAKGRVVQAILANKTDAPWGKILYDLAIAQGLVEPE